MVHPDDPALCAIIPAEQPVQAEEEDPAYVPAPHTLQLTAPCADPDLNDDIVPAPQTTQTVAPVVLTYVPAAHATHAVEFVAAEKVPAAHS